MLIDELNGGFLGRGARARGSRLYLQLELLEELLLEPGAVAGLMAELGAERCDAGLAAQLQALRRRVIHLVVSRESPYYGLSVEEALIVAAAQSPRFGPSLLQRELTRQPSWQELALRCTEWLKRGHDLFRAVAAAGAQWDWVARSKEEGLVGEAVFVGVRIASDRQELAQLLERSERELVCLHTTYVACAPSTAFDYLQSLRRTAPSQGWNVGALDRQLRRLSLGLLLVDSWLARPYSSPFHASPPGLELVKAALAEPQPGSWRLT